MKESNKKFLKFLIWAAVLYCIFFQFDTVIQKPILNILFALYGVVGDFGVAIIILTILVRLALWPMVSKQFKQTKKMQEIQPELAKIKKKANGNKTLEATMMQALYKEKEISPGGSMLTLLIQMPIFLAIFGIIRCFAGVADYTPDIAQQLTDQQAIVSVEGYEKGSDKDAENKILELTKIEKDYAYLKDSTYSFTEVIPRVNETIKTPDNFSPKFLGVFDLTHIATQDWVIMILAVLAAVFQYIQVAQTQVKKKDKNGGIMGMFKDAAKGKEMSQGEIMQQSMGSMTKFFPIMTFVIAINFPGALVLYYAVTSGVAILQQKIILHSLTNELERVADEKGFKNVKKIQEAEIVKEAPQKKKNKNNTTVRRITLDKKGGEK